MLEETVKPPLSTKHFRCDAYPNLGGRKRNAAPLAAYEQDVQEYGVTGKPEDRTVAAMLAAAGDGYIGSSKG